MSMKSIYGSKVRHTSTNLLFVSSYVEFYFIIKTNFYLHHRLYMLKQATKMIESIYNEKFVI